MASPTPTEAGYFSGPAIPNRYYYDCRPTDQLFDILPFEPIQGNELQLSTVDASASGGLKAHAAAVAAGAALTSTLPAIVKRSFALKRIAAELPVDAILRIHGAQNNLTQALVTLKVNAVRDQFKHLLVEGDSSVNAEEFDGLRKMAGDYTNETGANSSAANGGTVQSGEIEALLTMLTPRKADPNTYLVMHAQGFKHLLKNSYTDVEYYGHPMLGTLPAIAGVPIVLDNFVPLDETRGTSNDCTSVYAVMLGKDVGICGIYPSTSQAQPIQVRGPVAKESGDAMWYHVSWDVGLAAYNKCAVARLFGVKHGN